MKKTLYGKEAMDYLVQELVERKLTDEVGGVSVTIEEANFDDNFFDENEEIWDALQDNPDCVSFPEAAIEAEMENIIDDYDEDTVDENEVMDDAQRNLEEELAYWTVYFCPNSDDVDAALRARLTPFYYEDEFYLALGGCGMDLGPRQVWC